MKARLRSCIALIALLGTFGDVQGAPSPLSPSAKLIASGDYKDAAAWLEKYVADFPNSESAADAMFQLAQLHEAKLARPEESLRWYATLLVRFPDSRHSRRAETRIQILKQRMGRGKDDQRAFIDFQKEIQQQNIKTQLATAKALETIVEKWPLSSIAPEATFWIGNAYAREGRFNLAKTWLKRTRTKYSHSEFSHRADLALADIALRMGDFDDAEKRYLRIAKQFPTAPGIRDAITSVHRERNRARWTNLALAFFFLGLLSLLITCIRRSPQGWRSLKHIAPEFIFLCPVLTVLGIASLSANVVGSRAILMICAGSLLIIWLYGACTNTAKNRHQTLTAAGLALGGLVSLVYMAVTRERLLDLLAETWRHGPG